MVAAVVFFASLLAHELGHALQARREGVQIEGITLWLFGGVAKFAGEFLSAGAELRIAAAGPAASLAIGVAFELAAFAWPSPGAVSSTFAWLGYINLALLVFNLLFNLVEYISKPLSHSLRLFGNMYAGEIIFLLLWMMAATSLGGTAFASLLGLGWSIFHILIVVLQAYIFMMLTVVYVAMAHESH